MVMNKYRNKEYIKSRIKSLESMVKELSNEIEVLYEVLELAEKKIDVYKISNQEFEELQASDLETTMVRLLTNGKLTLYEGDLPRELDQGWFEVYKDKLNEFLESAKKEQLKI